MVWTEFYTLHAAHTEYAFYKIDIAKELNNVFVEWATLRIDKRDVYSTPYNMVYPIILPPLSPPPPSRRWVAYKLRGSVGGGATAAESGSGRRGSWSWWATGSVRVGFPRKKFQLHRRPSTRAAPSRTPSWKARRKLRKRRGTPFYSPYRLRVLDAPVLLPPLPSVFALASRTFLSPAPYSGVGRCNRDIVSFLRTHGKCLLQFQSGSLTSWLGRWLTNVYIV